MEGNSTQSVPLVYNLDKNQLEDLLGSWGEPRYRVDQVWKGLYQQVWAAPEEFTNLPADLRQRMEGNIRFRSLEPVQVLHSGDGETVKTLFTLPDKRAIETVLMTYERPGRFVFPPRPAVQWAVFSALPVKWVSNGI